MIYHKFDFDEMKSLGAKSQNTVLIIRVWNI